MTARRVSARQSEHFTRNDLLSMQHDEPVYGPNELGVALAPAHELRDRERLDGFLDDACEMLGERFARLAVAEDKVLSLAIAHALKLFDRHAAGAREAFERFGRFAVCADAG
jgi:hypothetical protein